MTDTDIDIVERLESEPTGHLLDVLDIEVRELRENHNLSLANLVQKAAAKIQSQAAEIKRLRELINTPETEDFLEGVKIEAAHQLERWGLDHDAEKTPWDWFWLIGYVSQKAASSMLSGDLNKAKHHMITTAAVMLNWHKRTAFPKGPSHE